jgi:hypothetical protein
MVKKRDRKFFAVMDRGLGVLMLLKIFGRGLFWLLLLWASSGLQAGDTGAAGTAFQAKGTNPSRGR